MSEVLDPGVEELRAARGTAAELKLQLVALRADLPEGLIFVFEGDDDRAVYLGWTRQIGLGVRYEPFTCGGKNGVIALWRALKRDVNNLGEDVYFFVDRDFDELKGDERDDSIFVTSKYSVENYLVDSDVLDHVLKTEFHCHGHPSVRRRVLDLFDRVYEMFLYITASYNRDLHVARVLGIELQKDLPKTVGKLAIIELDQVSPSGVAATEIVVVNPELSDEQRDRLRASFDAMDRRSRYRGKFALAFFRVWLEKLSVDRRNAESDLFSGLDFDVRVPLDRLTLATLAARCDPPYELEVFLEKVMARRENVSNNGVTLE
jgi:hypothetical protein